MKPCYFSEITTTSAEKVPFQKSWVQTSKVLNEGANDRPSQFGLEKKTHNFKLQMFFTKQKYHLSQEQTRMYFQKRK